MQTTRPYHRPTRFSCSGSLSELFLMNFLKTQLFTKLMRPLLGFYTEALILDYPRFNSFSIAYIWDLWTSYLSPLRPLSLPLEMRMTILSLGDCSEITWVWGTELSAGLLSVQGYFEILTRSSFCPSTLHTPLSSPSVPSEACPMLGKSDAATARMPRKESQCLAFESQMRVLNTRPRLGRKDLLNFQQLFEPNQKTNKMDPKEPSKITSP